MPRNKKKDYIKKSRKKHINNTIYIIALTYNYN